MLIVSVCNNSHKTVYRLFSNSFSGITNVEFVSIVGLGSSFLLTLPLIVNGISSTITKYFGNI